MIPPWSCGPAGCGPPGGVVVARDVTLAAAPGDVVAVEGPNGSGKSTLLAAWTPTG